LVRSRSTPRREAADNKAQAIDDLRASKMGKAADLVEQVVHETLTYYGFPDIHWQKIRTNNPLERIMKEIRRRVVGAFPRRSVLPQPGGRATTVHRRHNMLGQMLYEYETTLSARPI
jgi:transposase-like protein